MLWLSCAAGLYLIGIVTGVLFAAEMSMVWYEFWANLIYYLIFALLPLILLTRRRRGMFMAYRPNPISFFSVIVISLVALMGVFLFNGVTVLWSILLQELGLNINSLSLPMPNGTGELMLNVFTVAVLPAVCEEFVFRGALLSSLETQGTRRAIVISSLLFALLHGSVAALPAHFMLGLVMASLVINCNSIYAGMIYHTVHNAASVLLDYVNSRVPVEAAEPATDRLLEILGGAPGVLILIVELALGALILRFALGNFRLRAMLRGIRPYPRTSKPLLRREWVVLLLGGLLVVGLYAMDLATMLGFV